MIPVSSARRRVLLCAALFLGVFALGLPRLYPGLAMDDSPETVAVCMSLGIGHPPGYPLHTLLGHLAITLLPGGPAFALSLFGLACMAASVVLLGLLALELGGSVLAAGLALAGCPALIEAAFGPKGSVFTLNLALSLAILLALWKQWPRRAIFLLGLALAHHYLALALLLPLMAGIGLPRGKAWLWLLPGLSLWLYLPLRMPADPLINFGYVHDWAGAWAHVTRKFYAGQSPYPGVPEMLKGARAALGGLGQGTPWLLVLGALGCWALLKQGRAWMILLWLLLPTLAVGAYAAFESRNLFLLPVALIPSQAALAMLAGLGLPRLRPVLVVGLAIAAFTAFRAGDCSQRYEMEDYALGMQMTWPKDAVAFSWSSPAQQGSWYLRARGKRPDLIVIELGDYWRGLAKHEVERQHPPLKLDAGQDFPAFAADLLRQSRGRFPVLTTSRLPDQAGFGGWTQKAQRAMLFRTLKPAAAPGYFRVVQGG